MEQYSIKEVENLSGIKAHTIRIWEKRYAIAKPIRSATNIRAYTAEDLKKIMSISILNKNGYKISKLAKLDSDELNEIVQDLSNTQNSDAYHIDQLVMGMINLDERLFTEILSGIIVRKGFEKTVTDILYPFLDRIGILWVTQRISPAQEHFMSNLIRQKLIVAIDSLPIPDSNPSFLMYLRENEMHELGLLFLSFLIRKKGYKSYYLGQSVPTGDLIATCQVHKPDYIVTSLIAPDREESLISHFNTVCQAYPCKIIVSGSQVLNLEASKYPGDIQFFEKANTFAAFLDTLEA